MVEGPESINNKSEVIHKMSYEDFCSQVDKIRQPEGFYYKSGDHAYYAWATNNLSEAKDVDGAGTLLELYQKNVLDKVPDETNDFTEQEQWFRGVCKESRLPYPGDPLYSFKYQESLETRDKEIENNYKLWALENNISTSPGSVTVFRNEAGRSIVVYTDLESKGALIEPLDYN